MHGRRHYLSIWQINLIASYTCTLESEIVECLLILLSTKRFKLCFVANARKISLKSVSRKLSVVVSLAPCGKTRLLIAIVSGIEIGANELELSVSGLGESISCVCSGITGFRGSGIILPTGELEFLTGICWPPLPSGLERVSDC